MNNKNNKKKNKSNKRQNKTMTYHFLNKYKIKTKTRSAVANHDCLLNSQ